MKKTKKGRKEKEKKVGRNRKGKKRRRKEEDTGSEIGQRERRGATLCWPVTGSPWVDQISHWFASVLSGDLKAAAQHPSGVLLYFISCNMSLHTDQFTPLWTSITQSLYPITFFVSSPTLTACFWIDASSLQVDSAYQLSVEIMRSEKKGDVNGLQQNHVSMELRSSGSQKVCRQLCEWTGTMWKPSISTLSFLYVSSWLGPCHFTPEPLLLCNPSSTVY